MRYLPLTDSDRAQMLDVVGVSSIDDLFQDVPKSARLSDLVDLPKHQSEQAVERHMGKLSAKSVSAGSVPFFCGAGAYRHHIPATVDHLIQRSEFLTAYTPYQPEVSQGTLMTLFEFQSQVAALTGMDVANASMYDGSTACAEAVVMAKRVTRKTKAVLAPGLHPHYAAATQTLASTLNIQINERDCRPGRDDHMIDHIDDDTACVVVQSPNVFGEIIDLRPIAEKAHAHKALLIAVFTEPVALAAITPPGEQGADIVVGEGQGIGVGLNFGGPHVGLFACTQKLVRQMPGRVCGETVDANGERGFVLTLSTREQHIRREKATSNICTNSGLCALAFTIHMTLLGEAGITRLAALNHEAACDLADRLSAIDGVELVNDTFFNEFTLKLSKPAAEVVDALAEKNILGGVPLTRIQPDGDAHLLLVCATETNHTDDFAAFETALKEVLS
ncbi:putative glycine dehydrogenase (decarboxylating) subunit 1 [Algimonas ampicilliniresistens]|uniref:Probable glycine dehydrogenase (decarboxylating) subunit 1 n=1 Tax=Algimonas ampicilliniresistens TaxID=1298735 RepID=A0ABQ5VBY2_9PROT|nr:aminomethyl-transferring glycine dehydrogenase subunit GcvPA [Algimonas ampicilliniresistens]GLQ25031.1 putative glycine dehydrogenase (decarboxylating) subunit 1 [Algimonas ampicilliniresistens]